MLFWMKKDIVDWQILDFLSKESTTIQQILFVVLLPIWLLKYWQNKVIQEQSIGI